MNAWRVMVDRFRDRELVRTNYLGAERLYRIGAVVEDEGRRWRVTRHRVRPTTPWETIIVYAVRERV